MAKNGWNQLLFSSSKLVSHHCIWAEFGNRSILKIINLIPRSHADFPFGLHSFMGSSVCLNALCFGAAIHRIEHKELIAMLRSRSFQANFPRAVEREVRHIVDGKLCINYVRIDATQI